MKNDSNTGNRNVIRSGDSMPFVSDRERKESPQPWMTNARQRSTAARRRPAPMRGAPLTAANAIQLA